MYRTNGPMMTAPARRRFMNLMFRDEGLYFMQSGGAPYSGGTEIQGTRSRPGHWGRCGFRPGSDHGAPPRGRLPVLLRDASMEIIPLPR